MTKQSNNWSCVRAACVALILVLAAVPATVALAQQPDAGDAAAAQQEPPAPASLPQVEVRGTKEEAEQESGTMTLIRGRELEQAGGIADIIRYQPLVSAPGTATGATRGRSSFERGGTTGYNIRGIEGNRVGLDVDGVEMPDATTRPHVSRAGANTFGMGRDFMDPEMYSLVGISSGTTSAKRSAGGIGGAVSFRSKAAADFLSGGKTAYFEGKLGYEGTDRSRHEAVTAAGRTGSLNGIVVYSRRDGRELRNNSDAISSEPERWHSDALLLKGGLQADGANYLELTADLYRRRNRSTFSGWDADGERIVERSAQRNETERNTLQLSHEWTPSASWVDLLDTRVYFQDTDMRDDTDTTTLASAQTRHDMSRNQTRSWGLSSTGLRQIGRHDLSFGVNASSQRVDRPWSVAGSMKPQPDSSTIRFGAFVQDEIGFDVAGRRLALVPALRVDRTRSRPRDLANFISAQLTEEQAEDMYAGTMSQTIVSPSVSATYALRPGFLAYAQYRHSGRAPTPGEVYGSWNMDGGIDRSGTGPGLLGNKDLKPEKSDAVELGLKGTPTPGVALNTSVFYTRYKDFIGFTRYTRFMQPQMFEGVPSHRGIIYRAENRDQATIYGLELAARLEHGTWTPALRGLYTTWALGLSRGTSTSSYDGDKKVALDSVLPRKAVIGVGYDAPDKRWGASLIGSFVAGKQARDTNRESYSNAGEPLAESEVELFRVPGYGIFDVSAYWQLSRNVRLNAGVYNLIDKRYWDYSSARRLQPAVARDRRDMELLTNPGRTAFVTLTASF